MKLSSLSLIRDICFVVLTAALVNACTVKTLYNQLDWLIVDHLESYVELNNEQQKALYRQLDVTLLWHKSSQLPLYVKWMQDFKTDIYSNLSENAINENIKQFQLLLRVLRSQAADSLFPLLVSLSASQRIELFVSMEEKNKEFADQFIHISRTEQLEQYIERTTDRFDEWLGSITEQQYELIKTSAIKIKPIATDVLQSRRRWQAEFKSILDGQLDQAEGKMALHELFVNVERFRNENYKIGALHNQQVFTHLIYAIAGKLTKSQQRYLNNKVDNYSRHFTELAEEARLKLARQ